MPIIALLLTLFSGAFFGIGFFLVKRFHQNKELATVAIGLALTIMLGMLFFDLMPEIIELSNNIEQNKWVKILLIFLFMGIGMGILKVFDSFLPNHHHEHKEKEKNIEEHKHHMYHVGVILSFSLILHNILEGMSIYLIANKTLISGFFTAIGVGLHNLPLGVEIASGLEQEREKHTLWMKIILILSSSFGAFFLFLIPGGLSNFWQFLLISIACGMILYITLFELLKEAMAYRKKKSMYIGVGLGLILLITMLILS